MKSLFRCLALLLAGGLHAAAIALPGSGSPQWWLQLLALTLLVLLIRAESHGQEPWRATRKAALDGWLFSVAALSGTFWWLYISMHTYGGMSAPLSALAVLALAGLLSLYYALACALFALKSPRGVIGSGLLFAALWTLADLSRGNFFTGFPWGAGGYAHVDGPLASLAPWVGVYGIGAVAAFSAVLFARLLRGPNQHRIGAAVALTCLAASVFLASLPPHANDRRSAGKLDIELLQGNIPQDEKFVPGTGVATALSWYRAQLLGATASLVVTPETALPLLPNQLPPGYLQDIAQRFQVGHQAALIGIPLDEGMRYTNSVLGMQPGNAEFYRYDKHHLVPFGEFIPGLFRWFVDLMHIPLGDFLPGPLGQQPFLWKTQRIALNICYEDLFGEEIAASFADAGAAPTILMNVSNIAWFGDTIAIDQHLAISRMRSLEFQRPMVRATNTGATAVIDHRGEVQQLLPRVERAVLRAEVEGWFGVTPYARWASRFGHGPLWLFALAVVAWFLGPGRFRARAG